MEVHHESCTKENLSSSWTAGYCQCIFTILKVYTATINGLKNFCHYVIYKEKTTIMVDGAQLSSQKNWKKKSLYQPYTSFFAPQRILEN